MMSVKRVNKLRMGRQGASKPGISKHGIKTPRRHFLKSSMGLGAGLGVGAGLGQGLGALPAALISQERLMLGFGTQLSITAAHTDKNLLEGALGAAVARLRHIEAVMSLFLEGSQVSQLNRTGYLPAPDPDLLAILRLAQSVSKQSGGAFDVTVQPLWALWRESSLENRLPSATELRQAQTLVAWQDLQVSDKVVRFKRPGMGLTLNGIAQGYACDQARMTLKAKGIEHALLDLGEWSALGNAHDIGVAHPRQDNELLATVHLQSHKPGAAQSLATSSDAQMSFTRDHRFHHIFDPLTGTSPSLAASVSVLAESCALADALTKVFFMEASKSTGFDDWVDRSKVLCKAWGVEVILADKSGTVWSNVSS
jgi:FAD:protein FMN transferase